MSTQQQVRVQAGVPAGGQFATTPHSEADVSLDALADQYLDLASAPDEAERARLAETVRQAYDSAEHWTSRAGTVARSGGVIDKDDVAQEALLTVLEREANGRVIEDKKAYMHRAAYGVAQQAGNAAVRAEDRRALAMYGAAVEQKAADLGRSLTQSEKDEIVTSILANWRDPRHKPSADFMRYAGSREVHMEAFESAGTSEAFLHDSTTRAPQTAGVNEVAPDSFMDRALDAVDKDRPGTLLDARRMLYNALAETSGAPLVQAGTLSQRRVTALRATMSSAKGGVVGALRAWEDGETNDATEALFAPWGEDASMRELQQVCDLMNRFPDKAEDMWDSALKLANSRNAERV